MRPIPFTKRMKRLPTFARAGVMLRITGFNGCRDIPTPPLDAWEKELVEPAFRPPAPAKQAIPAK